MASSLVSLACCSTIFAISRSSSNSFSLQVLEASDNPSNSDRLSNKNNLRSDRPLVDGVHLRERLKNSRTAALVVKAKSGGVLASFSQRSRGCWFYGADSPLTGSERRPGRAYILWHGDVEEKYRYRLRGICSFGTNRGCRQLHGARGCPDDRKPSEVCGNRGS